MKIDEKSYPEMLPRARGDIILRRWAPVESESMRVRKPAATPMATIGPSADPDERQLYGGPVTSWRNASELPRRKCFANDRAFFDVFHAFALGASEYRMSSNSAFS